MSFTKRGHYVKENKGQSRPTSIVVIDVASKPIDGNDRPGITPKQFSHAAAIRYRSRGAESPTVTRSLFKVPERLWEFLRSATARKQETRVFGIHLPSVLTYMDTWTRFETGVLTWFADCEECQARQNTCELHRWKGYAILGNPPFILRCRFKQGNGTIKFIDLANYGVRSISELQTPDQFDSSGETRSDVAAVPDRNTPIQRCEVMLKWVLKWIETIQQNDLGNFRDTVAAQAWASWRHKGMPSGVLVHDNKPALKLERDSYYGGRTEAYRIGSITGHLRDGETIKHNTRQFQGLSFAERVYHVDFSWHYPAVMRENQFPAKILSWCDLGSMSILLESIRRYGVVARVRINSERNSYPIRFNGKSIYPIGRFETVLAGPELELALKRRHVVGVREMATYEMADLFSGWVNRLWALRMQYRLAGDVAGERLIKLIGDSLYGKFAQRKAVWQKDEATFATAPYAEWWGASDSYNGKSLFRSFAWQVERNRIATTKRKEIDLLTEEVQEFEYEIAEETSESIPAISAFITSYGRTKLLKAIETAGRDEVYYCDTDSLFVTEPGYNALSAAGMVADGNLGKLRLVAVYDQMRIEGYKRYTCGTKKVYAGLPGMARQNNGLSYEWSKQWSPRDIILSKGAATVREEAVKAEFHEEYKHGRVRSNGQVEPFYLEEF